MIPLVKGLKVCQAVRRPLTPTGFQEGENTTLAGKLYGSLTLKCQRTDLTTFYGIWSKVAVLKEDEGLDLFECVYCKEKVSVNNMVLGPGRGGPQARALTRKLWLFRNLNRSVRRKSTASESATPKSGGLGAVLSSAVTVGACSLLSDTIVQNMELYSARREAENSGKVDQKSYDPLRALRMLGYGFLFYGPVQHWWYGVLDRRFNNRTYLPHVVSKVALNQLVLGPIIVLSVFTWNFVLQGKANELSVKVKRDFAPSLVNAWKMWIPVAFANFYLIPLKRQVLFMSGCSIVWTGYLSYASNVAQGHKVAKKAE
ncbi:peroxisomal membrane protein Pmp22 [Chloropicon primus]|uniref:Peroxisomal membrane protein Pmp22 n=1 Tax=Chloropicon primus TaxID=1764295 RepID=A0A5B8MMI7_9CHLO|nr:peroxisomal membrane protein Pmp22 [Chloropicon primus]|eukprot:QDZ21669.1 peroxisomal membrane protein Pmp22 [Chloropicon primus]